MKAHEVLRAAHAVISDGWCSGNGVNARDAAGNPVQLFTGMDRARINPVATQFSLYGAICKAVNGQQQSEPALMWERLTIAARAHSAVPGGNNYVHSIIGFNEMEGQTQQAVLDLLTYVADSLDPPPQPLALPAPDSASS